MTRRSPDNEAALFDDAGESAAEPIALSERDSLFVIDLLANPPAPSARLLAAARRHLQRR